MNRAPYRLELASRVPAGPDRFVFRSADGVCSKQSFRTAELQLLEVLWNVELGDLACIEANYGVVGTVLAPQARSVHMTESSARAARLCERNVEENDVDASVSLRAGLGTEEHRYDTIAYAPKPYTPVELGKHRIVAGLQTLNPNGRLYLAASRQTGVSRYETCLRSHAENVEIVDSAEGNRVLTASRPETVDEPSFVSPRRVDERVDGVDLSLVTFPGVFSASGVDDGTRRLLESTTVADGERVLDLCCGYGTVGAYVGRTADCELWLSDDDFVSARCAERSLDASNVDGQVVVADCLDGVDEHRFDRILCNPPTHAGEYVLAELFDGAHRVLQSDGRLEIVHHRSLDLSIHLDRFDGIERLQVGHVYQVLRATP